MSQQHPQWGQPPQQPYGTPPPGWGPPPKRPMSTGKVVAIVFASIIGGLILIGAMVDSTDSSSGKDSSTAADTRTEDPKGDAAAAAEDEPAADPEPSKSVKTEKPKKKVVTFKVWGTAPNGALGPLDITYGSDSDTRKGEWKNGKFTATLPLDDDAMYYSLMAQLQGSGDINCSVTVDGHTEKAHAAGGYNICHAQANAGLLGGWD